MNEDHERLPQGEFLRRRNALWRRFQPRHDLGGVSAKELEQEENKQDDPQQCGNHLPEASQNIGKHKVSGLA